MLTFPKLLIGIGAALFGTVFVCALFKDKKSVATSAPQEIELGHEVVVAAQPIVAPPQVKVSAPVVAEERKPKKVEVKESASESLPEADRVDELFSLTEPKLPIVQTITYKSRVAWQKGRPAWLADYAKHYQTSRHFIARSLNGKPDYLKQDLKEGAKFNVLRDDINFKFHVLIDVSHCKLWLYYDDIDSHKRVLIKSYRVGLGRIDPSRTSGYLTPFGQYSLGNKVAIYKPNVMGFHNGQRVEMITVFGTRWIPFDKEIKKNTAPAKGLGLHGVPWNGSSGSLVEDKSSLGKYQSDGCIRLASNDIEELYSIVISRPTTIEIVKDYSDREEF